MMKRKGNAEHIAHRLLRSYVLLAILTASSVTWLSWEISCHAEDRVIRKYLLFAAEHWDGDQNAGAQSLTPLIQVFSRPEKLPPDLVIARDLPPGFHEVASGEREKHLLIRQRSPGAGRLYVVADMPELRNAPSMIILLLGVILMISLGGVVIGFLVTRRALRPLVNLTNTVSRSRGGKLPPGFSDAFARDEIGTLARQMERYVRQREQFMENERRFLQDASHELRTPLTVLQGAIELLRTSAHCRSGPSERPLERMERSIFRMQHTVECLLWLAHEENKTPPASQQEFYQAINDLVAEWKAVLPPEIALTANIDSDCMLDGPLHLWLIAVRNLIENAAHHTDSGKIDVTVASDRIAVSDTGCGISREALSGITEAWTHGPRTRGYGLGLSIVNRIAKRMGRVVRIESEPGRGTTVAIERR
jgi:signal transduction histidine kinase